MPLMSTKKKLKEKERPGISGINPITNKARSPNTSMFGGGKAPTEVTKEAVKEDETKRNKGYKGIVKDLDTEMRKRSSKDEDVKPKKKKFYPWLSDEV